MGRSADFRYSKRYEVKLRLEFFLGHGNSKCAKSNSKCIFTSNSKIFPNSKFFQKTYFYCIFLNIFNLILIINIYA